MAATGNASSQYLQTSVGAFSPITAAYTWSMWYFPAGAPAFGGVNKHPFSLSNSTGGSPGGYDINFCWDHNLVGFYKAAIHRNADTSFSVAQHPGTPASGAWHHVAAVFNGSTLKLYYDGVEVASVAASAPSATDGSPELTVCAHDSGGGFDDAPTADLAIWNVALTAAQIMQLRQGYAPATVQASPVSYSKLNTADITTTGPALTNSGATLNVTYFAGSDGGLVLGGNTTAATAQYNWTNSGGLVIGGNTTPLTQRTTASNTIAVSEFGTVRPTVRNNVAVSQSGSAVSVFGGGSNNVLVSQRATPITHGVLAAGRSKGSTSR